MQTSLTAQPGRSAPVGKYLDGNIRKLHYLSGGDGVFAIYVDNTMKSDSLYYIHKDHLGSIETITDETGMVLQKLSFDPWGRKRNSINWSYNSNGIANALFDRGYTMHEHHNIFGLINMNGRMYDPWVGRMLSPDPFIQDPTNLQNYNRYSYALNNPLKYTDPTGYLPAPTILDMEGSGGADINYEAYSSLNYRYDFSSANNRANDYFGLTYDKDGFLTTNTPTYDRHSGYYRDPKGNILDFSKVFNNFVAPNSSSLPANTIISSIKATVGGYEFCTVDPIPYPIYSNSSSEVNLHFVYGGNGKSLDGGGLPSLEGFSLDLGFLTLGGGMPFSGLSMAFLKDSRDYVGIALTFNLINVGGEYTALGVNKVTGRRLNHSPLNIDDTFGYGGSESYGVWFASYSKASDSFLNFYGDSSFIIESHGISAGWPISWAKYQTYTIGFSITSLPAIIKRWKKP